MSDIRAERIKYIYKLSILKKEVILVTFPGYFQKKKITKKEKKDIGMMNLYSAVRQKKVEE